MQMSNNRHLINDFDIVRPAQLLDKGIPLPGLSGRYVVDEGWVAIITEGGAYKEVLQPGTHFLGKYHFWRDVKAIAVETRIQTLHVSTTREFTISQPVPVEINLDLAVEYRVVEARRVALEVKTPLTSLYDRVIQAVRGAVAYTTVDEIRTQGEGIARTTFQRLQGMQLPKVLGIELFNVLVTTIKATDAGTDALAVQQMKEFTTVRDWQLDSAMIQQSRMSWEWLLVHRPEIAQQMLATYGDIAKEMVDKGLLDPAGFLNQPANMPGQNWGPMNLGNLLGPISGFPAAPGGTTMGGMGQSQTPTPSGSAQLSDGGDIHARIREEVRLLRGISGTQIETQPGVDESGIPDGSYDLRVALPRISGGSIVLYFVCGQGYPQALPAVEAEVDGQEQPFQPAVLRRWTGQYLVEIAREAQKWFG